MESYLLTTVRRQPFTTPTVPQQSFVKANCFPTTIHLGSCSPVYLLLLVPDVDLSGLAFGHVVHLTNVQAMQHVQMIIVRLSSAIYDFVLLKTIHTSQP